MTTESTSSETSVSESDITIDSENSAQSDSSDKDSSLAPDNSNDGDEIMDMATLLEQSGMADLRPLRRGEVIEGHVMDVERDGLVVDIGYKSEGIVPQQEMLSLGADPLTKVSSGDALLVYVLQPETPAGQVALSIDRARGEQGWRVLQTRFEEGEVFDGEITGFNKGGLLANVEGVNAFIPMSQVVGVKPTTDGGNPLSSQVGRSLQLKVIEINRKRNRVILSERAALQEWRAEQKDRLLEELAEGQICTGTITSIRNFGVFVDLGGADGLVHLSELSWDRDAQPESLFNIGDQVQVFILKIDKDTKKIALSIRRATPEQWEQMITKYAVDDIVPGIITKLVPFGAFARLPGPVEGLVHVSEVVDRRIQHPQEVLEDGDIVPLKIVRIEHERHRLGLSLRGAIVDENLEDGWEFDREGHVITLSENAKQLFENESSELESKLNDRHAKHLEDLANLPEEPIVPVSEANDTSGSPQNDDGSNSDSADTKKSKQDEGPILTAMQQAMQQAQARQEESSDDEMAESNPEVDPEVEASVDTSSSDDEV
ncbi:MAG: S1 RNA-binding domain-containing protein [Dehalococcoidia bacterium]|nr:S1 RNA-binding domain-containing protein [Dehalococcoidia bacterium]